MKRMDRRELISTGARSGAAAGLVSALTRCSQPKPLERPATTEEGPKDRNKVRDRLWIFTCVAGSDNDHLRKGGVTIESRMTPAEGAFYLGVPNLLMIRWRGLPPLDNLEQYTLAFRPLRRVIWSIVGGGGKAEGDELPYVLALTEKFSNIHGVFLDDFFVPKEAGDKVRTGALSPDQLRSLRARLEASGKQLEMWVTFYSRVFEPSYRHHFEVDLPLSSYLDLFDVVTMWTRGEDRLENLERYLDELEKASPASQKALGCDFWDFHNEAPVPITLMEHQCELGLKWLKEGRIREMIFLANTVMDVGLENVEWTRKWIEEVGDEDLGR